MSSPTAAIIYEFLLRQLHQLIQEGKGDSSEAGYLADLMDVPWNEMIESDQLRMRQLSRELYIQA